MKKIELTAQLFGRSFKILEIQIKEIVMKTELVKIRITDAYGIGYAAGHEYNVEPQEANKLIDAGKAIALTELPKGKVENAKAKNNKVEKR